MDFDDLLWTCGKCGWLGPSDEVKGECPKCAAPWAPEEPPEEPKPAEADSELATPDELAARRAPQPHPGVVAWSQHNLNSHGVYHTSPVLVEAQRQHVAAFPNCHWRP